MAIPQLSEHELVAALKRGDTPERSIDPTVQQKANDNENSPEAASTRHQSEIVLSSSDGKTPRSAPVTGTVEHRGQRSVPEK